MDKVIAFVHAKGSSERVPGKNMRMINGVPLFCYAVVNAMNAKLVDEVVVDSDSDEILEYGAYFGATKLKRPERLATNKATGDDLAYWQASNRPKSKIILQVVPTSPFIEPGTIDRAIQMLLSSMYNSVVGCRKEVFYTWTDGKPDYYIGDYIPNSSEKEPITYETTGLYVNRTDAVLKTKRRLDPNNCAPIYLSRLEAVDINTEEDFEFAEMLLT